MDPLLGDRGGSRRPGDRGRGAGDRRDLSRPPGRVDGHGRLLLVLPEQEPRRLRRRRPGDDERRGAGARRSGCCATTAREPNTFTSGSAATSGSTRCRRRCCGSSCRTWRAGRTCGGRTPSAIGSCSATGADGRPAGRAVRAAATSTTSTSSAVPDRDRVRAALTERGDRHRDLLPGAVPPAGVLRLARLPARRLPGSRSRRRPRHWRCRSTAS